MEEYRFEVEEFFPRKLYEQIAETRVTNPDFPLEVAQRRERRSHLAEDGKLTILAADHPARMVTNIGEDRTALGNRYELLGRVRRVLSLPGWDGVMGTTDILEELLILDGLERKQSGKGFLDNRVMVGCMNRGGLKGVAFEMDDRFTSFTARSLDEMKLEGAKFMFRLTPSGEEGSGTTIGYCAEAISGLNQVGVTSFLECLPVGDMENGYGTIKRAEDLIRVIGVATALGDSSRNIWLKVPYCDDFDRVALATTCPILILGGEATGDPTPLFQEFISGMAAGSNVRGALAGRNILFPGNDDPRGVAAAVHGIVHDGYGLEEAREKMGRERDKSE